MTTLDSPPELKTPPAVPTDTKRPIARIVGGLVLVLIGALWLLQRAGIVDLNVTTVLALGTMVTGVSLMILSREGPHPGLIVLGTILAVVTLATATAPFEGFQGGVGDRTVVVASAGDIATEYNLAMGKLVIDLSDVDDLEIDTPLTASVGTGELIVRVPAGSNVSVEARVGAGQIQVFGREVDGVGLDETLFSPGYDPDAPTFVLDLAVFTGRVEVSYE